MYRYYITPEEYDIAEKNGIKRDEVNRRVRSSAWTVEDAITKPNREFKDYDDWLQVALDNNINRNTFYSRTRRGWSPEEAAQKELIKPIDQVDAMNSKDRVIPKKYIRLAERNGIKYHTMRMRIRKGWSYEDACTKKPMTKTEVGRLGAKAYEDKHGSLFDNMFPEARSKMR